MVQPRFTWTFNDFFFQGTLCHQACANQIEFDPTKSSTFVDGAVHTNITFVTGVGVDPVVNDDYTMDLQSGTDTVSVGGLTVVNTTLFLITNQTEKFGIDTFSGILGVPKAVTRLQVWLSFRIG